MKKPKSPIFPIKSIAENNTKNKYKKSILLNPCFEPLTIEKLRTMEGYQHSTDAQAASVVTAIEQLALILYERVKVSATENINNIDNQQVVYLNKEKEKQILLLTNSVTTKRKAA